jgi:hypothetical protein
VGAAITPKPRVTSITWCSSGGIEVAGNCQITAALQNGIAPIQVRFEVTRSDQAGTTIYDYGSPTRTISVSPGNYALSIKAIPREQTYTRVGYYTIQDIPVCTTQAALLGDDTPVTSATVNCGGGGGDEN